MLTFVLCCFLQTRSVPPGTAPCSMLTCERVWRDRRSLQPQTQWTSCWPKTWRWTTLRCRRSCRSLASKTSGCGHGKSSNVSAFCLACFSKPRAGKDALLSSRSPGSLSVGYYLGVSAPPGVLTLTVPCQLGEVELALAFEMFITVNATAILQVAETTTCSLSITLKRYLVSVAARSLAELRNSVLCVTLPLLLFLLLLQDSKL